MHQILVIGFENVMITQWAIGAKMTSSHRINIDTTSSLARLFSWYCHSPGVGGGGVWRHAKTLTFYNISVITEDMYLKLRVVVHYQKGNLYQKGR